MRKAYLLVQGRMQLRFTGKARMISQSLLSFHLLFSKANRKTALVAVLFLGPVGDQCSSSLTSASGVVELDECGSVFASSKASEKQHSALSSRCRVLNEVS